jgi:hypothetical protein
MDLGSRQRWAVCTSETAGFKANSETASCLQISQRSTHQLAPRLPLAADRRRSVRRTAHCPTGTETSFSLTTYLTCASASGSRTVDRPAVRLPCFRHGARLCSRPSSDPQRADCRGGQVLAIGLASAARTRCAPGEERDGRRLRCRTPIRVGACTRSQRGRRDPSSGTEARSAGLRRAGAAGSR